MEGVFYHLFYLIIFIFLIGMFLYLFAFYMKSSDEACRICDLSEQIHNSVT